MAAVQTPSAHVHCAVSQPSIIVASNLKMTCPTHGNTHPPLFPLPFDLGQSGQSTGSTKSSITSLFVTSLPVVAATSNDCVFYQFQHCLSSLTSRPLGLRYVISPADRNLRFPLHHSRLLFFFFSFSFFFFFVTLLLRFL